MAVQVEYRQLGKSGLRISVPILGCMGYGTPQWMPWVLSEDKALPVMKAAWDAGINTFDTANMYSNGVGERVVAAFLNKYSIPRKDVVILDKVCYLTTPDDISVIGTVRPDLLKTKKYVNKAGLSRLAIFTEVAASLERLGTDYIDLMQIHDWDATVPVEETMRAFNDLVVAGKILYIGASNMKAWQVGELNAVAERHGWPQIVSIQVEHSLLYRPHEVETMAYALYKGIGVLAYAPLNDGNLARPLGTRTQRTTILEGTPFAKNPSSSDEEIIKRVQQAASKHGWTMSQVALAWSASKATSPIVGAGSPQHLEQNIFTSKTLTGEEIKYLEEPYEMRGYRWG
ncbi:Aldo/keto reductase [Vararia minispora EC-137]|uniref:Aldo/keto reductase n=1 Tax=Vararia minispora EC-137 TaxID=1314806 RepID=A0ACB8QX21_9AGAM|nr:Aldo/keto reductase [Vararia minispora EC-137]